MIVYISKQEKETFCPEKFQIIYVTTLPYSALSPSVKTAYVAHILVALNKKNPESDIGTNAEDQRNRAARL